MCGTTIPTKAMMPATDTAAAVTSEPATMTRRLNNSMSTPRCAALSSPSATRFSSLPAQPQDDRASQAKGQEQSHVAPTDELDAAQLLRQDRLGTAGVPRTHGEGERQLHHRPEERAYHDPGEQKGLRGEPASPLRKGVDAGHREQPGDKRADRLRGRRQNGGRSDQGGRREADEDRSPAPRPRRRRPCTDRPADCVAGSGRRRRPSREGYRPARRRRPSARARPRRWRRLRQNVGIGQRGAKQMVADDRGDSRQRHDPGNVGIAGDDAQEHHARERTSQRQKNERVRPCRPAFAAIAPVCCCRPALRGGERRAADWRPTRCPQARVSARRRLPDSAAPRSQGVPRLALNGFARGARYAASCSAASARRGPGRVSSAAPDVEKKRLFFTAGTTPQPGSAFSRGTTMRSR